MKKTRLDTAFNESAFTGAASDELARPAWVRLCVWGDHANPVGIQRVKPDNVAGLIRKFNEAKTAGGANWPGFPIYKGHPDGPQAAQRGWLDKGRIGWVTGIEPRPDGLYVERTWNEEGQRVARNRQFPYPSVVWDLDPGPGGTLTPDEFVSVGMVEEPCMGKSCAWNEEPNPQPNTNDMDLKALAAKLKLPETATLEDCMAALDKLIEQAGQAANEKSKCDTTTAENERLKAEVATLNGKVTAANEATKAMGTKAAKALVACAVADGRVSAAEMDGKVTAFNENFEKAEGELGKLAKRFDTRPVNINPGEARQRIVSYNEAQRKMTDAVKAHAKATGKDHTTAFNEVYYGTEQAELRAIIEKGPEA